MCPLANQIFGLYLAPYRGWAASDLVYDRASDRGRLLWRSRPRGHPSGTLEVALIAAGCGGRIALASLRRTAAAGLSFQRVRAQTGYLTCDVAAAYDAVISLPRLTVQRDLGF